MSGSELVAQFCTNSDTWELQNPSQSIYVLLVQNSLPVPDAVEQIQRFQGAFRPIYFLWD